jgi:hypothetical protein
VPWVRAYRGAAEAVRQWVQWLRAFVAVLIRPWLWWVALRQVARMAPPEWWRHAPFLPVPPAAYLRFRLETAYGVVTAPAPADLVAYLTWCGSATRSGASGHTDHLRAGRLRAGQLRGGFRARR